MINITADCIFSNWILVWSIIYIFKIIDVPSPFYSIILALIYNAYSSFSILYNNGKLKDFIIFWILVFITKIYPAYLIGKPKNSNGLYFGISLFIIYLLYAVYTMGVKDLKCMIRENHTKYGPGTTCIIKFVEKIA